MIMTSFGGSGDDVDNDERIVEIRGRRKSRRRPSRLFLTIQVSVTSLGSVNEMKRRMKDKVACLDMVK